MCESCDLGMCGECWLQVVDGKPWCQACVALRLQPVPAGVPVLGVVLMVGVSALVSRALPFPPAWLWGGAGVSALLSVIAAWRLVVRSNQRRAQRKVEARAQQAPPENPRGGHPYRGAARRVGRRIAPPLSGLMAFFVVGGAFALTAAVLPSLLSLPRWLEIEIVLGAWWLVWAITFAVLLYRGWRVARDYP